jgi:DNA repair protein RAD16
LQSGTVLNNYAHIFEILIRLRQAVDHPYLVIHSNVQTGLTHSSSADTSAENGAERLAIRCGLCDELAEDPVQASCGHQFCRECAQSYMESFTYPSGGNNSPVDNSQSRLLCIPSKPDRVLCPECNQPLTLSFASSSRNDSSYNASISKWDASKHRKKSILSKIELTKFRTSTKMEALMEVSSCCAVSSFIQKMGVFQLRSCAEWKKKSMAAKLLFSLSLSTCLM